MHCRPGAALRVLSPMGEPFFECVPVVGRYVCTGGKVSTNKNGGIVSKNMGTIEVKFVQRFHAIKPDISNVSNDISAVNDWFLLYVVYIQQASPKQFFF